MHKVLVLGAGKIGSLIAILLAASNDYEVTLADVKAEDGKRDDFFKQYAHLKILTLDAADNTAMAAFLKKNPMETMVSCLPFYCNPLVMRLAKEFQLNYFDLTEDTNVSQMARELAKNIPTAFVPQCGLAPGFINIVANDLMQRFSSVESVKMRVGALPVNTNNALQYSLTWSTDGLINQYGNPCEVIEEGKVICVPPLDDLEEIEIDGSLYEAFNTSGGVGSLAKAYQGKVKHLNYKTIRYPGHCQKMRFLMKDLFLNEDRATLKHILEKALPKTDQDVVLVYVSVTGQKEGQFSEENYVKKFYPQKINNMNGSAIQLTTASSLCAVLDRIAMQPGKYKGWVPQETFSLGEIVENRFGNYFCI